MPHQLTTTQIIAGIDALKKCLDDPTMTHCGIAVYVYIAMREADRPLKELSHDNEGEIENKMGGDRTASG